MKQLSDNGSSVVIAVDFGAAGRRAGTFADLASLLRRPVSVWLTEPPPLSADLDGEAMLHTWLEEATQLDGEIIGLFGFCTGAVFASAMTSRLPDRGGRQPQLLLFDPESSDDDHVVRQFVHVVNGRLSTAVPDSARPGLEACAQDLARRSTGAQLGWELGLLLRENVEQGLQSMGLEPHMAAELCDTVVGYLSFLGAAAELDGPEAWKGSLTISSTTTTTGLDALPEGVRSSVDSVEERIDVAYQDLLRSPQAAAAADRWLSSLMVDRVRG